jgi:hypothetical protein
MKKNKWWLIIRDRDLVFDLRLLLFFLVGLSLDLFTTHKHLSSIFLYSSNLYWWHSYLFKRLKIRYITRKYIKGVREKKVDYTYSPKYNQDKELTYEFHVLNEEWILNGMNNKSFKTFDELVIYIKNFNIELFREEKLNKLL